MNWHDDEEKIERKALLTMGAAIILVAVIVATGQYITLLINH